MIKEAGSLSLARNAGSERTFTEDEKGLTEAQQQGQMHRLLRCKCHRLRTSHSSASIPAGYNF